MNKKENYLDNIVYLRGVMILIVVLGHALTICVGDYAGHQMIRSSIGAGLRQIVYSFHMPIFMAISGYLYYFEVQRSKEKYTIDGYDRFLLKLLVPFVIILYFWRKPLFWVADPSMYAGMSIQQIICSYLSFSTTGALWFLYTLFAIFAAQRLFVNIIWKSNRTICLCFGGFALASVASVFFSGPIHHVMLYNYYFFLGTAFHQYQKVFQASEIKWLTLTGAVAVLGTVGLIAWPLSGLAGSIYNMVLSTADIAFALLISEKTKNFGKTILSQISDWSMGIYLFHEPLIIAVGSKLPNMGGDYSC